MPISFSIEGKHMLISGKDAKIIVEMNAADPISEDRQEFYLLGIAKFMTAIPAKTNLIIISVALHGEGNVGQFPKVFKSDLNAFFDGVIHQFIVASGT